MKTRAVRRSAVLATCVAGVLHAAVQAAELPVPCSPGACGTTGPQAWLGSGLAGLVQSGAQLTVTQQTESATLNWQSFNVSPDGRVTFVQPNAAAVALNRIFQADPSRIFGRIDANGRVFLLNRNGIVFEPGSQANVGGLLASTLDFSPAAVELGLARAASQRAPALQPYVGADGSPLPSGAVEIGEGSRITTPSGGQVLIFAPEIHNRGEIRTPDGQILMAAGQRAFLVASPDADVRGLLVEVGDGGTVTNGDPAAGVAIVGSLVADRGNVTIAAAAVNQSGRISATTSTRANGSIRLLARDTQRTTLPGVNQLVAERTGTAEVGQGSVTSVTLDPTDETTSVDVNEQARSSVEIFGRNVTLGKDSLVRATAGRIEIVGVDDPARSPNATLPTPDDSRVFVDSGAVIDVSGATTELPMERNSLRVELRGSELGDFPLQRDGALRGEAVYVDVRRSGERSDGSLWQGSPVGDLSGNLTTIARDVRERNLAGGSITLRSQGAVMVADRATLDVSGGAITWRDGYVRTSRVLGADGRTYDIGDASPDRLYVGIVGEQSIRDTRWGLEGTFALFGDPRGTFERGYVEGKDAGSVSLIAPRVALDGLIGGRTNVGPFQRSPRSSSFTGLYRPYDERPAGARLTIGVDATVAEGALNNLVTSRIVIGPGQTLAGYVNEDGTRFDPRTDPVPATFDTTWISSSLFEAGRVGSVALYANGSIVLAPNQPLELPPGESFLAEAAVIEVRSGILIPGGEIDLAARPTAEVALQPRVLVEGGVALDVAGLWTNDSTVLGATVVTGAPQFPDGGRVALSVTDGGLVVEPGARLDVSGGAVRGSNGRVVGGSGGSIALGTRSVLGEGGNEYSMAAELVGYALERGGSLSITVDAACVSMLACEDAVAQRFAPEVFTSGGFSRYAISSNLGDLVVARGTSVAPVQSNYVLAESSRTAPSGTRLSSIADVVTLPDTHRRPTSLTLAGRNTLARATGTAYGDLVVEEGAAIVADPGAALSFGSNSRVVFGGVARAPGGDITLTLDNSLPSGQFLPDQGIWLESTALLDVRGTTLLSPDPIPGRRTGEVQAGGSVRIEAERGYVIGLQGSRIDVRGSIDSLDVRDATGTYSRRPIATRGGSVTIAATEGAVLDTAYDARGGSLSVPAGRFELSIDSRRNDDEAGTFPGTSRQITIAAGAAPIGIAPGTAIPDSLNGVARIPAALLEASGFDVLAFRALSTPPLLLRPASVARIVLEPEVSLAPRSRLIIESPEIGVAGAGTVRLSSAYVALGPSDRELQLSPASFTPGAGRLQVNARLIDLVGDVTFNGIDATRLRATDAVRAVGVAEISGVDYVGRARFGGDLEIEAGSTLGSTATRYAIESTDMIRWRPAASATVPNLSAGADLTFRAPGIVVDGTVEAPFGVLRFEAQSIEVGANGRLATGTDSLVPFGRVEAGTDWVYKLEGDRTRVFGPGERPLPSKSIELAAGVIELLPGSVIDVGGGGDLLAYEFQPGPTGSLDLLDAAIGAEYFAILPAAPSAFASYDPREYRGSSLLPGDSLYLAGGGGIAAGEYALYPARYALLPGAVLVRAAPGFEGILPGQSIAQSDGSTIVAGYRTLAGSGAVEALYAGFAVADARAAVPRLARYETSLANEFFSGRADSSFALPRDAGDLRLAAGAGLRAAGSLESAPAAAGRAARVDVAAERLRIVPRIAAPVAGVVQILDSDLRGLASGSLLVGGRRVGTPNGVAVEADAREVVVAPGALLEGGELLLAARDLVTLESGAKLVARGGTGGADALELRGGSALVGASSGDGPTVTRASGTTGAGRLTVERGSTIEAAGSALLAATGDADLLGELALTGAALGLELASLELVDGVVDGANQFTRAQLDGSGARSLSIGLGADLAVLGDVELALDCADIRARSIVARDIDARLVVSAKTVRLAGTEVNSAMAGDAAGTLLFTADEFVLAGGNIQLAAGTAELAAARPLAVEGTGALSATGALALDGGLAIAVAGVDYAIEAAGDLSVQGGAASPSALGGALVLAGSDVTVDGALLADAGLITVRGRTGVAVGPNAIVSTAAPLRETDGLVLPIDAGSIGLSATAGDVDVAAGARLLADAQGGGRGGTVALTATQGRVDFEGTLQAGGAAGGSVAVDAVGFDFGRLGSAAQTGGATGAFSARLRGPGSLSLDAGSTLRAGKVTLVAEQGGISLLGTVDARRPGGGSVALAADRDVTVSGRILLQSTESTPELSPLLEVASRSGFVLERSGEIAFGDVAGAELRMRLPRDRVLTLTGSGPAAIRLDGTVSGQPVATVEGYREYVTGSITAQNTAASAANQWFAHASEFVEAAAGAAERLGSQVDARVVPGIDVVSGTTLSLDANWQVANWRFGSLPPIITLRSAGDLRINASLSDGFTGLTGTTGFLLPTTPFDSASYRLVAGGDLGSVAALSVLPADASAASVIIAPGTPRPATGTAQPSFRMIRTGTGFIDVAAAGDLVLSNQASVIYTAGVRGPGIRFNNSPRFGGLNGLPYPEKGGDIRISVGRDVIGSGSRQLYTEWLWRTGSRAGETLPRASAWTIAFDYFEQGVAALAGGSVIVEAGRSVRNLSASAPSIGRQLGGTTIAANRVEVVGGGLVSIRAGGDITGGNYFAGLGAVDLVAGGSIGRSDAQPASLAPLFGLGDAVATASARRDLELDTAVNPTLLTQSRRLPSPFARSFIGTYGARSAVTLVAAGGDVRVGTNTDTLLSSGPLAAFYADTFYSLETAAAILPPRLDAFAPSGDLRVGGTIALWPSPRGGLTLVAEENLSFDPVAGGASFNVLISDLDSGSFLPTPERPSDALIGNDLFRSPYTADPNFYAPVPIHSVGGSIDGIADPVPSRLIAVRGDVSFLPGSGSGTFGLVFSAESVRVIAGRDIQDLGLRAQNVADGDVTSLIAGRDIRYRLDRDQQTGNIVSSERELTFGGPGAVELVAGRDIDLQTSRGITTEGGLRNAFFRDEPGASLSLAAGLAGREPDYDAFIDAYLVEADDYREQLREYVTRATGQAPTGDSVALAAFRSLSLAEQRVLLQQILFAELRAGGRLAAQAGPTNNDFTRAFEALETYFPGANPDLETGESNPYEGDVRLVFSRVYTLAGGDVSLLVPGGAVDVGLAAPPDSFGVAKDAAELGIVVQSVGDVASLSYADFQVNESRVFAGDGGDILVWSTRGDIDAGRGAKTAISAPPPVITIDEQGQPSIAFPAAFAGSGIQTLATSIGREPGDVDLFAPRGVVNAGDAGIVAGNLTIAATAVLGANNITVSGTAVGVPVETGGLGAAIAGASAAGSSATTSATADLAASEEQSSETPLADSAIRFLEVFVTGLGEDQCRPDDLECLRRQPQR